MSAREMYNGIVQDLQQRGVETGIRCGVKNYLCVRLYLEEENYGGSYSWRTDNCEAYAFMICDTKQSDKKEKWIPCYIPRVYKDPCGLFLLTLQKIIQEWNDIYEAMSALPQPIAEEIQPHIGKQQEQDFDQIFIMHRGLKKICKMERVEAKITAGAIRRMAEFADQTDHV